ncbi:MAG: hypothetical protein CMJ64_26270 [Planctomycetaceae bacterium]|nr:hypothetical protein [Planctomycetaceae bacterium]
MASVTFAMVLAITVSQNGPINPEEIEYQNAVFQQWWETDLVWAFDALPEKGIVPSFRIPYSGHDYPDKAGGTIQALRKYDAAFNRGRNSAAKFEHADVNAFKEPTVVRRGLFGLRRKVAEETPNWHGHCNGWTAAAIRHAEPQRSVRRNRVVFSPSDIKGLLAEIYMYRDNEFLGGVDDVIHPATLHVVISNWIGRGELPIGIETSPGKEKWNYPLYAFATTSKKHSDKEVEVKMNAAYSQSTRREFDRSQHLKRTIYFHYLLTLNDEGDITGGRYYPDSNRIDMLWAPLHPVQGGQEGNERGNPHLAVKEVLAIWRESVSEDLRNKWWNIDPTEEDRITGEPTSDTESEAETPVTSAAAAAASEAASDRSVRRESRSANEPRSRDTPDETPIRRGLFGRRRF